MSMFINLHAIQQPGPSLLNRDDLGAAKTVNYGGAPRTRISSQSFKRAQREYQRDHRIDGGKYSIATAQWPRLTSEALAADHGFESDVADARVAAAFALIGIKYNEKNDKGNTAVSITAPEGTDKKLAQIIVDNEELLISGSAAAQAPVKADLLAALDPDGAIDLAEFGRFIAEVTVLNFDAAVAVSHAFSVSPFAAVEDFFVLVDDAAKDGETKGGNMGFTPLDAPTLYRTATIDVEQLRRNLNGDEGLVEKAIHSYIEAFTKALPGAKKNSTNQGILPAVVVASIGVDRRTADNAYSNPIPNGVDVLATATTRLLKQLAINSRVDTARTVVLSLDESTDAVVVDGEGFEIATGLIELSDAAYAAATA